LESSNLLKAKLLVPRTFFFKTSLKKLSAVLKLGFSIKLSSFDGVAFFSIYLDPLAAPLWNFLPLKLSRISSTSLFGVLVVAAPFSMFTAGGGAGSDAGGKIYYSIAWTLTVEETRILV
jgi:hypothetical protein